MVKVNLGSANPDSIDVTQEAIQDALGLDNSRCEAHWDKGRDIFHACDSHAEIVREYLKYMKDEGIRDMEAVFALYYLGQLVGKALSNPFAMLMGRDEE